MLLLILSFILIIFILFILFLDKFNTNIINYFGNTSTNFKAPPSFTKLSIREADTKLSEFEAAKNNPTKKSLLDRYTNKLNEVIQNNTSIVNKVNIIQIPTFFNSGEKWPGCLPRPLYQGSCGSCWGFATVTCLSSRFFIESCGNSCGTYPQINNGSIDDVYSNINQLYNFNKIHIKNFTDYVDVNKDGNITKNEWIGIIKILQKKLWILPKNSQERYFIYQILVNILDFQSLGSISLKEPKDVEKRAHKTFNIWLNILNDIHNKKDTKINSKQLLDYWRKQPLNLSAEKLISCCINCYILEFNAGENEKINNPVCIGGSLTDAWTLLRDIGTPETLCIGYNLDNYLEGEELPTCRELQGPFYSFCIGQRFKDSELTNSDINTELNKIENSGAYPPSITFESKYPWIDPQLMRFKAKNAYTISNNMAEIQREIIQRGPVNSGFYVYNDFEVKFGGQGKGGQLYDGTNPLGSDSNCLIYMRDPELKDKPTGGHAITIVGWGTYIYKKNNIEYHIPYWTCLNSWGVEWGHNGFSDYKNRTDIPKNMKGGGYFWIVRGINNCGIEENVTCGQPNIENLSYPGIINQYGWGADPPSVDNKHITFLPPLDTKSLSVNNKNLEISPTIIGGGGYVDFIPPSTYDIKSMTAPSPYVMFWQTNRPTYCIGHTLNSLTNSISDNVIVINKKTFDYLNIIRNNIYKNPLLLIGDLDNQEQVQLIKLDKNQIIIARGVNFNKIIKHNANSIIKIFPYQDLTIKFLEDNKFITCPISK